MASCFLVLCLFCHVIYAALPEVDFNRMGKVGLAGAFSGLDLFQNSSVSFDPTTSTMLSRSSDGALTRLASTNQAGRILTGCTMGDTFYFGGSFSSIADISASNVASYTFSSGAFAALGSDGPNGQVNALFCDAKDGKIWAGGNFTSPGSSVALWDIRSGLWSKPPFVGVTGARSEVLSITTNSSDASLFFAGSFITSFQDSGSVVLNGTYNPNVPFSLGATPFSSSLVPIPLQQAQVDASPSSTNGQFNNIATVLCPSGPDGPGNTWFAADGSEALVTVRTFTYMSISGIRLGNTFQSDHGTTGFSVTTIPDNTVQTLHYLDSSNGQTETCSNPCPLSTDSTILYQDFLFDNALAITGVQIKLSQFVGAAPGLHLLQLLSSGAFVSQSGNDQSCFAPNPSNTSRSGDWVAKVTNTDIAGTTQTVLVSTVDVGTPATSGPSFTWIPYVSGSGNYDISLLVPGCTNFQDCPLRTTVQVTVFPGKGLQPWVSTVSQQNNDDATVLIYSGPVLSSSPDFVTTIFMTLADSPAGSGEGGKYELVADRVQLVLKSVGNDSSNDSADGLPGSVQGTRNGFGFFEWPRSLNTSSDATKVLPNTSMTSLDSVGFDIFNGIGGYNGVTSKSIALSAVAHHPSGVIFLGGDFALSSGATNIVLYKSGNLVNIADMGLNGPVTSLVLHDDQLFVGGAFNDTRSLSFGGKLQGIAMYDVQTGVWTPLGAGLDGQVTYIGMVNEQIQVAGNFTLLSASATTNVSMAGFAVWDLKTSTWVNSGGFLVGSMTFVGNGTSSSQIIAGNVVTSQKFGASGMIMLANGDSNGPEITPLGAQLDGASSQATFDSNPGRRRSHIPRAAGWISHVNLSRFFGRQATSIQLPPLPPALPAPAPAVLAGTFWTNSSSIEVAIIGGNFSFSSPGSSTVSGGVAVYDPASASLKGLSGQQVNGSVRSLLVYDDQLYVGGEFSIEGTSANGLAVYDLTNQRWNVNEMQPLQPSTNGQVTVRSITRSSSKPDTVVVAGSFAQAGSLSCQSICAFDTISKQWNALGKGIQGEVASVAYAGNNQEILIASGSIALSDNSISNVVQFSFSNTTWTALGTPEQLPGPVTAVEVNGGNVSSIFAAGRSLDDTSAFLSFWNGFSWATLGPTFMEKTTVAQLTMVPLQNTHSVNGVVEPDRMLMISGSLASSFGNVSAALFDGQTFIPYIVTTSSTGAPGTVSSLFHSFASFSFSHRSVLAVGVVILISIAIAAGVVFLLALIGILWTLFSRRDDKVNKFDGGEEDDDDSAHHRPSSLLEHINAATRTTILGASPFGNNSTEKGEEKMAKEVEDPFGPDASNYLRAETPSDAVGGMMTEETSRLAHARYSFDGTGEGELPISTGAEVEVLDDRDPAWWYARDVRTGREGVVPAAYLY